MLQLLANYSKCLPSLLVFTFSYSLTETMPRKFHWSGNIRFTDSEKDRYYSKISKWQHELVREYKQGKLVFYLLNNAAKNMFIWAKHFREHWNQVPFSLKHFFIWRTLSTQVVTAPLGLSILFSYYLNNKILRILWTITSQVPVCGI